MTITFKTLAFSRDDRPHEMSCRVAGEVLFGDRGVMFASGGHTYFILFENIVKIIEE